VERDIEEKTNVINELRNQLRDSVRKEEGLRASIRELERSLGCEQEKVQMISESRDKYMIELQQTREQVSNAQNQITVGSHETIRHEQRKNQAEIEVIDLKN
jgi:hypothetical protein